MLRNFTTRHRLAILLAVLSVVVLVLVGRWLNATKVGGQGPAEPFRIAGNFYYVGATDAAAFLITGPEGHVVLDAGYPTTAKLIMGSIAKLGFDIKDVKVLLNSEPHADHGGGLAALQQASGAELWASEASAACLTAACPSARAVSRASIALGVRMRARASTIARRVSSSHARNPNASDGTAASDIADRAAIQLFRRAGMPAASISATAASGKEI